MTVRFYDTKSKAEKAADAELSRLDSKWTRLTVELDCGKKKMWYWELTSSLGFFGCVHVFVTDDGFYRASITTGEFDESGKPVEYRSRYDSEHMTVAEAVNDVVDVLNDKISTMKEISRLADATIGRNRLIEENDE